MALVTLTAQIVLEVEGDADSLSDHIFRSDAVLKALGLDPWRVQTNNAVVKAACDKTNRAVWLKTELLKGGDA